MPPNVLKFVVSRNYENSAHFGAYLVTDKVNSKDSSIQVREWTPVGFSAKSRGGAGVDVKEGHRPSRQSLRVEPAGLSGSIVHTDGRDQVISPPNGARFGDEPIEDPIQGSCEARRSEDPSLAKGSPTSPRNRDAWKRF